MKYSFCSTLIVFIEYVYTKTFFLRYNKKTQQDQRLKKYSITYKNACLVELFLKTNF